MTAQYKCDFCGAPRIRTENVCKFCGQVFQEKKFELKNINLKKPDKEIKFIKYFKNPIDFSFLIKVTSLLKKEFIDSSIKTALVINKTEKRSRKFIFNNSKLILVAFAGLTFWIITIKLITDYSRLQETKRTIKKEEEIVLRNNKQKKLNNQIAESKILNKDLEGALEAYYKSIEIPSNNKSSSEDRDAYKGIAEIKLKQNNYKAAAKNLTKLIDKELTKDLVEIYFKRGFAYYSLKKYTLAKNDLSQALWLSKYDGIPESISNFHLNLYYWRSESFLKTGNFRNAIADINKVITKDKSNKPGYFQIRSSANYFLGKYEDSISDATKSIEFIKNDKQSKSLALITRAKSYKAKNNYKLSCLDFEKAYKFNKFKLNSTVNSEFYKNICAERGVYHLANPWSPSREGKSYDLKFYYKDSFFEKEDPEKEKYLLKRISALFKKGNFNEKICEQSLDISNSLIKVSQNSDGYFYRGRSKSLCKADHDGAIKDLNKAINLEPNNAEYIYYRGITNDLDGNQDEAINDFKTAINMDPSKHYYYYSLGITLYKLGQYQNSINELSNSLYLNNYSWSGYTGSTYNFTYTYRGLLNRAKAKRKLKKYLSGLKDLEVAIKECLNDLCNPTEPYIEKGNIQFLLDDTQSACSSWRKGFEKDWESQLKLENIGNDSLYNIYQDFCT